MTKIKIAYCVPGYEKDINNFMKDKDVVDVKISKENSDVIVMIIYREG